MYKTVNCPYCGHEMIILFINSGIFRCGTFIKDHSSIDYKFFDRYKIKTLQEKYYNTGCGNPIEISLENGEITLKKCLWSKPIVKTDPLEFINFRGIPYNRNMPENFIENTGTFISNYEYNKNIRLVNLVIKSALNEPTAGNQNLLCSIYTALNGLRMAGVYIPILTPEKMGTLRNYFMHNDYINDPADVIEAICKKANITPRELGIGRSFEYIQGGNVLSISLFRGTPNSPAGHHTIFIDIPNTSDNKIINDDQITKVPTVKSYTPFYNGIVFIVRELYDSKARNAFIELINATNFGSKLPISDL